MLEMRAAHFQHNNFPPWGGRAARGMLGGVRNRLVAAVPHFNFPPPGRAEPHGGCWVECETGSSPLFHTSTSLPLVGQSRTGDVGWSAKQARRRCFTLQLPSLWGGRAARRPGQSGEVAEQQTYLLENFAGQDSAGA